MEPKRMKPTHFVLLLLLFMLLPAKTHGIKCFFCRSFEANKDCPPASADHRVWSQKSYAYGGRDGIDPTDDPMMCAVGYESLSGKVHIQVNDSEVNKRKNGLRKLRRKNLPGHKSGDLVTKSYLTTKVITMVKLFIYF